MSKDLESDRAAKLQTLIFDLLPHIGYANLPQDMQHRIGEVFVADGRESRWMSEMSESETDNAKLFPPRIWAGGILYSEFRKRWADGYWSDMATDEDCVEYIRADIVAEKDAEIKHLTTENNQIRADAIGDMAAIRSQVGDMNQIQGAVMVAYEAEITRLENIIAAMSARGVDAAQARDDALKEILEWVPRCTCHEGYSSRGLIAPDCQYHASGMEEVEEIVRGLLAAEEKG